MKNRCYAVWTVSRHGNDRPREVMPVPDGKHVGLCNDDCMLSAPVQVTGDTAEIGFFYEGDVYVIAGFMSSDYMHIYWIIRDGEECAVSDAFGMLLDGEDAISCTVLVPDGARPGRVVFWMVSGEPVTLVDWLNGPYELMYYFPD